MQDNDDWDALGQLIATLPAGAAMSDLPREKINAIKGGAEYLEHISRMENARLALQSRFSFLDLPGEDQLKVSRIYRDSRNALVKQEESTTTLKAVTNDQK